MPPLLPIKALLGKFKWFGEFRSGKGGFFGNFDDFLLFVVVWIKTTKMMKKPMENICKNSHGVTGGFPEIFPFL